MREQETIGITNAFTVFLGLLFLHVGFSIAGYGFISDFSLVAPGFPLGKAIQTAFKFGPDLSLEAEILSRLRSQEMRHHTLLEQACLDSEIKTKGILTFPSDFLEPYLSEKVIQEWKQKSVGLKSPKEWHVASSSMLLALDVSGYPLVATANEDSLRKNFPMLQVGMPNVFKDSPKKPQSTAEAIKLLGNPDECFSFSLIWRAHQLMEKMVPKRKGFIIYCFPAFLWLITCFYLSHTKAPFPLFDFSISCIGALILISIFFHFSFPSYRRADPAPDELKLNGKNETRMKMDFQAYLDDLEKEKKITSLEKTIVQEALAQE